MADGNRLKLEDKLDAICEKLGDLVDKNELINTMTDETTGTKYQIGINNGLVFIEEVNS